MIQFPLQCVRLLTRYSSSLLPLSSRSTKGKRVHGAAPDPKHKVDKQIVFPAECCRRPGASPVKTPSSAAQLAPLCFYFWLLRTKQTARGAPAVWRRDCWSKLQRQTAQRGELYLHFLIISCQRDKLSGHLKQKQKPGDGPEGALRSIRLYSLSAPRVRMHSHWLQEERLWNS